MWAASRRIDDTLHLCWIFGYGRGLPALQYRHEKERQHPADRNGHHARPAGPPHSWIILQPGQGNQISPQHDISAGQKLMRNQQL
eukprot:2457018-Pleurochrysis_carterae.AAC.2